MLTGLLCGLVPAFAASRTGVNDALKEGGRTGTAGGGHARLRSVLVVAELAVALVLLTAAGLLLRSFEKLRSVDLGFRTDHMLTASYGLPQQQYSTQAAVDSFNCDAAAQAWPVAGCAGCGRHLTCCRRSGDPGARPLLPDGYVPPKGAELNLGWPSQVLGDYFHAAGIPIIRGRDFTAADREGSPLVTIVNRTLAQHYWPGQDPIGKRIRIGVAESPTPWMTVVGEIGDIKQTAADQDTQAQFYQPAARRKTSLARLPRPRCSTPPAAPSCFAPRSRPIRWPMPLRSTVHSIDPQLALTQVESMDQVVSEGQAPRRFNTALISSFAAAAVLLALLGIYGVIAFSAALRTQEMAIRLALGAQRAGVMRLVLVSGANLASSAAASARWQRFLQRA